jgi:hypothetical protein
LSSAETLSSTARFCFVWTLHDLWLFILCSFTVGLSEPVALLPPQDYCWNQFCF